MPCTKRSDSREEKRNYLAIRDRKRKANVYQSEIKMVSSETYWEKKERKKCIQRKGREYTRERECGRSERVKGNDSTSHQDKNRR